MLPPNVAAPRHTVAHPHAPRRVDDTLLALDEWLFNPAGWFVIDTNNVAVKGLVIPTLQAGLDVLGHGRNAALVGRLRPGASVIDIDVPGTFGHWIAHEAASWLKERNLWHLIRPSGGEDGRHHVFCAHGAHKDALQTYLADLTEELRLRRTDLDLRDAVRPLSSPHRHGTITRPSGDLREALRSLKRSFGTVPAASSIGRRTRVTARTPGAISREAARGNVVPLFTPGRRVRAISEDWHTYLNTGTAPAVEGAERYGRSVIEAGLTLELVWAGHDARTAWQLIRQAHPRAMAKARNQGWSWWIKYVWNSAVEAADAFAPATNSAPPAVSPQVRFAVAEARERLETLMWSQPLRSRAALLLVGHHVLDRMERTGALRVPCPERDLVLDTGLADRKTIRSALRLLDSRVGQLHRDCLSPTHKDTSSFEFEIMATRDEGVRQFPPPVSHPPPLPRGLWATLPRSSHTLWRTLATSPTPLSLQDLAHNSGLVHQRGDLPTKSQLRTTRTAVSELARAGLATVDEQGQWATGTAPRSVQIQERAATAYEALHEHIKAERAAYRAGTTATWTADRARAIKRHIANQKAWWKTLSPAAQADRSDAYRYQFDQMSISQQAAHKSILAERRHHAGEIERDHHQAWLDGLTADEFLHRSLDRKQHFAALASAERGLAIATWQHHRHRYGLERGAPPPRQQVESDLLPDTSTERDRAFLERQLHLDHKADTASQAVS